MPLRLGASVLAIVLSAAGCASGPSREPPLHTVQVGDRNDTLVVMLPGIKDRAEQFSGRRFRRRRRGRRGVRRPRRRAADERLRPRHARRAIACRSHRTGASTRLRRDLAARRLDRRLRLAALRERVSGGHPRHRAPFPLPRRPWCAARNHRSGGLDDWRATTHEPPFLDGWRALKGLTERSDTTILLGFGGQDRLAETYAPLLEALPRSQIYTADGGHEWTTWTPLWQEIKTTIDTELRAD